MDQGPSNTRGWHFHDWHAEKCQTALSWLKKTRIYFLYSLHPVQSCRIVSQPSSGERRSAPRKRRQSITRSQGDFHQSHAQFRITDHPNMHAFELWEEVGSPGEKCRNKNQQGAFFLWGNSNTSTQLCEMGIRRDNVWCNATPAKALSFACSEDVIKCISSHRDCLTAAMQCMYLRRQLGLVKMTVSIGSEEYNSIRLHLKLQISLGIGITFVHWFSEDRNQKVWLPVTPCWSQQLRTELRQFNS